MSQCDRMKSTLLLLGEGSQGSLGLLQRCSGVPRWTQMALLGEACVFMAGSWFHFMNNK